MADPHLPDPRPDAGTRVIRADRLTREKGTGLADPELPKPYPRPDRTSR